jgi:predicted enzyme related to lactoylglutathione lyase
MIYPVISYAPSHAGTLVYLTVDDIDGALARVQAGGGKTLMPKMHWCLWFHRAFRR